MFFFFSSRRRHTRCSRDWSSDVCSSDLHDALVSTEKAEQGATDRRLVAAGKMHRLGHRDARGSRELLGPFLVECLRRGVRARAGEGDAAVLEELLRGAILATRAVQGEKEGELKRPRIVERFRQRAVSGVSGRRE